MIDEIAISKLERLSCSQQELPIVVIVVVVVVVVAATGNVVVILLVGTL